MWSKKRRNALTHAKSGCWNSEELRSPPSRTSELPWYRPSPNAILLPTSTEFLNLQDQFDCIDFSDNDIRKIDGFPLLYRIKTLLFSNNRIWWVRVLSTPFCSIKHIFWGQLTLLSFMDCSSCVSSSRRKPDVILTAHRGSDPAGVLGPRVPTFVFRMSSRRDVCWLLLICYSRIGENLQESLPSLESLILTNNMMQELGDLDPLIPLKKLQYLRWWMKR